MLNRNPINALTAVRRYQDELKRAIYQNKVIMKRERDGSSEFRRKKNTFQSFQFTVSGCSDPSIVQNDIQYRIAMCSIFEMCPKQWWQRRSFANISHMCDVTMSKIDHLFGRHVQIRVL